MLHLSLSGQVFFLQPPFVFFVHIKMGKISSYKKLKEENARLRQDIYKLVMFDSPTNEVGFMDYAETKAWWTLHFEILKVLWAGAPEKRSEKA